ncbi:MAG TPA: 2-hydroxyacyl-CoA dehydratase family protein [Thermoanaerobaculia bacterium]
MPEPGGEVVGRGLRQGGDLLRGWFAELTAAAERGEGAAYVFVMGSLVELLRSFDLPVVFPEINSLQTAVKRVAASHLNEAEELGYSPDICGYVKADVATQRRGGEHPMGRIPRPALAVLTTACNTYIKWGEIWERTYRVPVAVIDVPGSRRAGDAFAPGDGDFERDCFYVAGQLRELVRTCESVTGRRFDVDRLRENLAWSNAALAGWRRALAANRAAPAPFNALIDGTVYLGVLNGLRGTPAGAVFFSDLAEEMELKAASGLGTLHDELWRLLFVGVPCYPIFRRFNELFTERGGVFVGSTYLWFASGGAQAPFSYDLEDPLRGLATGLLLSVRAAVDSMLFHDRALDELLDGLRADGVVFHAVKSCRTTSAGLADGRRALLERREVASLLLESDMMDQRVVSEAQLKNRVDAFFEGLAARRAGALA